MQQIDTGISEPRITAAQSAGLPRAGVLAPYRVVELGTGPALAYCGKLFADFGAEVLKIEPPGGDPGRREPPSLTLADGAAESAYFAWLNTSKRSIAADPANPADLEWLRAVLADADVLLDARPPAIVSQGPLAHAALRAVNPRLTVTAISWFGEDGPYRDFVCSDIVCRSLAGLVALIGPKERPVAINDHQADIITGLSAFIPTAAGLWSGQPRRFPSARWNRSRFCRSPTLPTARPDRAAGVASIASSTAIPPEFSAAAKAGLGIGAGPPAQWFAFWDMFGLPEVARDPRFATSDARVARADELEALFAPRLLERTAEEWFAEGLRRRLPFAVVPSIPEMAGMALFRGMSAFAPVRIGDASFDAPVLPQRLPRTPPRAGGVAPLLETGRTRPAPSRRNAPTASRAAETLPLAGLKIVDLTMGWAGPIVTRQAADLGAEVIKVESCQYYDWWRGSDRQSAVYAERRYEKRPNYLVLNRNKLGITLDLTSSAGVALLQRLVARADVVVENYSREVLPKLGLDYAALRKVRPDLLMISMPAFPAGPWERGRAYGYTLEEAAGVPSIAGEEGMPPMMNHYAYGDAIGGLNATAALLLGLLHKQATGEGQHVELSQVQCMLPMIAPWFIAHDVTGQVPPRTGNRHPVYVPQNCFPCAGDDSWVMVSVLDDAMWQRLCRCIGRADLATDPTLATAGGRARAINAIEAAIAAWTRDWPADEAMNRLQLAGVAAGVVRSPFDLGSEPQFVARGYWQPVDRPWVGRHDQPSAPYRENGVPYPVRHAAPTLGEFNDQVLGGLLGLSEAELAALREAGVIGTEGRPPSAESRHAGTGAS